MSKNLFHDISNRDEIRKILAAHPRQPLVPPLDSESWQKAAGNPLLKPLAAALRARAEEEIGQPMPPLTDELYALYSQTGSRWEHELTFFERRRRVGRAAISLLLSEKNDPDRPKLIESLLAKIAETMDEPSWAFPAHVNISWHFPAQKDTSSGKDAFVIDLFGAETANLMAELLNYFGAIIPADLRERILVRLREQFWDNYLGKGPYPTFGWATSGNNWNAVCHQGVIGSALAMCEDDDLLADMLFSAKKYLPIFLSGFGADGGSSEGPGYWDYGFGWFAILNEQLETRTGGELSLFEGDSHVVEIARFAPRSSLSNGLLICFSDSNPIGILRPPTLKYLGERLNDSLCQDQALSNYILKINGPIDLDSQRVDLFFLSRYFLRAPLELPKTPPARASKDIYMADLAVMIADGTDSNGHLWELAAKAGHNNEHHNHNDCGNYILNIDGNRFVTEIGQPLYNKDFFSEKRYENVAARTLSHSLPRINGCEQAAGSEYASKLVEYTNTPEETLFRVDLTACYPKEAACRQLIRTLLFEKKAGRLSVRDEFELDEVREAETAIVTIHPVKIGKDTATLSSGKLSLVFQLDEGSALVGVEEHRYHHHDPKITELVNIQRIVIKPSTLTTRFTLGYSAELS